MNTSEGGQQPQKAGAGAFGGHNNPVPAQFQHEDDEEIRLTTAGYRRVCDGMAASIVRLEHENDELRAEVAVLREERAIILRDATKQTLKVGAVKSHWVAAYQERDQWRECAERLIEYAHESLTNLGTWGNGYERYSRQMEQIRADIAEFDRLKGETK